MTCVDDDAGVRATRRGLIFACAGLAMFMTAVNASIVATALDALQHSLQTTVGWAGWTITAYGAAMLVMLPISGKMADHYGRRRVFVLSAVGFTAASLACGLAGNIFTLIALRVVQAACGAGFTPAATGLFAEHFGQGRDRAISLYGSIFSVGAMAGPIFGGLFVAHLSWRFIFYLNVPIGLVVIASSLAFIPPDRARDPARGGRSDLRGAVLLAAGLLAGMLTASALTESLPIGVKLLAVTVLALAAVLAIAGFFRHIHRVRAPFIPPRLITGTGFGAVNTLSFLFGGAAIGTISLVPLYAANRYGLTALAAGTLLIAQGAADGIFTTISALLLRRTGYRLPMYVGGAATVVGTFGLALPPLSGMSPALWLACCTFLIGVGTGAFGPATRVAGLEIVPEHAGMISSLRSMEFQAGGIAVVSIATAAMTGAGHPAATQALVYGATAIAVLVAMPVIHRVLDHRGSW
jgi:MFS family permease